MPHFPKPFFKKNRGVWYVEINRQQINLGPDRDKAFRCYHSLMSAEPEQYRVPSDSLAAIVDAFLEWVQRNRAADTYEWYRYRLERFVRRYPDLRSDQLRPYHVETWVDGYELSVTSRRNYFRTVKRCLKWAKRQGYVDQNPIADLEVPAGEHKEVVVSAGDFERLLSFIRNPNLEDLVRVTWESGCRPQESLRVEAWHVDLANQRWVIPKSESKMKRLVRVVYLTDAAFQITKRLVEGFPQGPLFRNVNGKPWTTEAVNCAFSQIRHRMGREEMARRGINISDDGIVAVIPTLNPIRMSRGESVEKTAAELRAEAKKKLTQRRASELAPRYSLYALRHSWVTHALQKGVDPLTVAILMGHQDPSMLSKVYQHLSLNPTHMLEQARKAAS